MGGKRLPREGVERAVPAESRSLETLSGGCPFPHACFSFILMLNTGKQSVHTVENCPLGR